MNTDIFTPYAKVLVNEPMRRHTTFKIGGNADLLLIPEDIDGLNGCLERIREHNIPCLLIGNGSNLLVSDKGIEGAVIKLGKGFEKITLNDEGGITAFAGARLSDICRFAQKNSLTGLEFAYGIPGTLGGGIFMNAGAYGGELKDVITRVTALDEKGEVVTFTAEECDFSYRYSVFALRGDCVILSADLKLSKGDSTAIAEKMEDILSRRKDKQPLEYPSAGSVFRRPEGHFAGALIEGAGLKGVSVGGAQVSCKHAGFIINTGNATCSDVGRLIDIIKDTVYEKYGVRLHCEICFVGRE